MDKVKTFSKMAHESAGYILPIQEDMKEKGLDTIKQCIHLSKSAFDRIEDKTSIDIAVNEGHRLCLLFASIVEFSLSAAHCLLEDSVTPEELADRITDLYRRKNTDYGDAFARSLDKYGIVAALVRINDKVNRIESLTAPDREAQVKDEPILDTFLDLASYAIMSVMWIKEDVEDKTIGSNSLGSKSR